MNFDEVLPAAVGAFEQWAHTGLLRKIAVVRDLRGQVRFAIDLDSEDRALLDELVELLRQKLGAWFSGDVLSTRIGKIPLRNIARNIVDDLAPPWPAPLWRDATGIEHPADPARWRLLERRMGKLPWLEGRVEPPWPDDAQDPTVVTFFSFKGGVGRTTTLASCAIQAARQGERVALIDLDLEAPGLGSLFGVTADRGLLDLLVEHLATGEVDVRSIHQPARDLPDDLGDWINVFPAGRLDSSYLEKLSRLDFSGAVHDSGAPSIPVRDALLTILQQVRTEFRPQWIFLDARAGLHDLAGLSLHGMAHLDVLFSRANAQGVAGLDLVLGALARRQRDAASRICLVHALAPVTVPEADAERARLQNHTYEMFTSHGLFTAQPPERSAPDADHRPWTLRRIEAIERNDRISDIVRELESDDFKEVWSRIRLLTSSARQAPPAPPLTSTGSAS